MHSATDSVAREGSAAGRKPRRGGHNGRLSPEVPRELHVRAITVSSVWLAWRASPAHAAGHQSVKYYELLRDDVVLGRSQSTSFKDTAVTAGRAYRYAVRVVGKHRWRGPRSPSLLVRVPRNPPAAQGGPAAAPAATGASPTRLSAAMVDRMLWRAGFGPGPADRGRWVGRAQSDLVDWLMSTPAGYAPSSTPPLTADGKAIDPLVTDDELVLEWLDRMQRATNPLAERLAFFWHRHWAVSRRAGIPARFLLAYRDRLHRYGDLGSNSSVSFRDLAIEMSTVDAAMSQYLNGSENVAEHANENYAREFMELFCLGVVNDAGQPNYAQADVTSLARAFTGWALNQDEASPAYGRVAFEAGRFDSGTKTLLGRTGALDALASIDIVLAHPAHAPFLVRKFWREFIATPIPSEALASLTATYASSGLRLAPLVRAILMHPLIFESLDAPNLVKPPIVLCVGVLRTLGIPLQGSVIPDAMTEMQQLPYFPPNVAGWEGGLAWLNSNTAQARFDLLVRAQNLKYGAYPGTRALDDIAGETPNAAFDRAHASVGYAWLSPASRARLVEYANSAPADSPERRRQRVYALQAFILGGPDGQVM